MEELYTLSDGSQVDISGYSQFEKTSFLMKNPGAKKQKGVTKSAGVTSKKPQAQNGESTQVDGSSVSQKFRLAGEGDLDIMQKRGILPPPSAQPRMSVDQVKSLYDLKENSIEEKAKWQQATFKQPGARKAFNTKIKLNGSEEELKKFVNNFSDDPVTGALGEDSKYKISKLKEKIQETDSELQNPYMYYSSENQEQPDDFVEKNYNKKELEGLGINSQDFDGYLNKKGYKEDFLKKESEGLFEGEGDNFFTGYNIGLAKELSKKKMLNMYMEDMQRRDFTKQNLYQDIEIIEGNRDKKDILNNELFDTNGIVKYVEKNFPIITEKLKERDAENAKLYQESKSGGTDFFSWDTVGKIGESGWNAIVDRTSQLSSTAYQMIGMEGTAEGIRAMNEENKFLEPINRGITYVSGKSINYQGTKYIVDSKGEIYDADAKIRVTDIFDQKTKDKLVEDSKYGQSDWSFSLQGAAVQTSGVMADMLIQAAVTRGVGEFGVIASETRLALTGARKTSAFTSLLNDSSALLRKIPLKKSTGYSMISQGTLGYSQGYEDTLKAARDNGINDKEAFELAGVAAQRMAILYSTTGVISPQTKVVENIFGSKSIIKKAIEQYTKTGTKGFVSYLDNMIKNTPRNLIEFAEEGGKEVIQENTQQILENKGVNYMTNRDAGKKIMNETFSADDFVNTSILSFVSAGLMAKAKLPSFHTDDKIDDLMSLSTLAKNKKEFTKVIDGLVGQKVFTNEQAKSLKQDVDIYSNNINKILKTTPTDAAMPIMRELDKVSKLTDEKQTVDKAFHPQIDQKIEDIRNNINKIYYESELKVKNEAISKAIKKGVVKDIQMKSFSNTEDLKKYLVEELNMPEDTADLYSGQTGFAITGKTLKQYSKNPELISDNAQVIVVDESKTLDAGVIQHEFLHGLLQNTLKDNPEAQKLIGVALSKELMKIHDTLVSKGSKEKVISGSFMQRIGAYVERSTKQKAESLKELELKKISAEGDSALIAQAEAEHNDYIAGVEGVQWEEMLTLYSDALRSGEITYNENTFTKLGDVLRRVLQYLGIKDIKFESGKDVYNFIKDYNSSVESGNWGKAFKKMGTKGATINTEKLSKETGIGQTTASKTTTKSDFRTDAKFSLAEDRKSPEAIKKDVNKGYDKEKWSTGSNIKGENPAINKVLYDILQEYDYIIKGKSKALGYANLPDFSQIDMIAETQMELIPHIRNFNKEFFEKREEFKKQLEEKGLDPKSKEFKDKVEEQDLKGYKGKKGVVKENDDLNAWINSQLVNKMGNALRSGNVTTQKFTEDIDNEMFKETKIIDGYGGEEGYLMDEGDNIFDAEQDYDAEQSQLARLLNDPVYNFVDRNGVPINIETIPFGGFFITEASDPTVAANRKLKTETDPIKIQQLKRQLDNLQRGLDLQAKKDITPEEREELKGLKSFKSYDLSTGMMVNTFEALSVEDTPSKIISDEVGREILRSPNIETLEYRNFKEKLSTLSKTMSRRMTFKNGPEIESFMYNNWKLLYDVINHPVDPITGESSYASKKLPPRLKMFDEKGDLNKIKDITRVKFLQSYYGIEEATRIIKTYGNAKTIKELNNFDDVEISEVTGKNLWHTAYFDRRTALMELFGDVMVLQEARRLIREPSFLDKVKDRNVNLYNELKDDVIRAQVLNNMAKGKSDIIKFSLAEGIKENKEFLNKFPNLLNSKEYKSFTSKVKDIYHSGSDIEKNWKKNDIKAIWFSAGASQGWYGDGTLYKTNLVSIPGSIVMPDWNRSGDVWNERFAKKFPEVQEALLKDMYDKGENVEYVTDDKGNTLYDDNLKNVTWEEYLEEEFPQIFNLTGKISLDEFIEVGKSRGQDKVFENIVSNYFKKDKNRKPLTKKLTFKEYKDKELEFEQPTPNILWLLKPENIKYADKVILEYIKGYEEDPDSYLEQTEGKRDNPDGTLGDYTELIVIGPMKGQKIEKQDNKGVYSPIKFSLAEEKNGRISTFLNGLPFSEQWVVARDIDTAIRKARIASSAEQVEIAKLKDQISKTIDPVKRKELKDRITELKKSDKITFKVPSRSKMTDKSTAYFIISKVAEGYNDFEFTVKKNATGPLTAQVLEALDFKSKNAEKTRELNSNLEESMNKIIEENKGVEASETFSAETAKNIGKNIGKNKIYLPPEDEDFLGLLYTLASGKGKVGEEQLKFFEDNLIKPYSEAMLNLMHARQVMYKDWKDLINNKHKGISKLLKQDSGYGGYLVDQAVRVYLWEVAGYKIPGLDNKDLFNLKQVVRTNPKLRAFAEDVRFLSKQANGYTEPDNNWGFGSIVGDINNIISKSNRVKYLEHWKSNVEKIFSDQNMNKIEAVYGKRYVKALEDILGRMKTGSNRAIGANDAMLNWINGSTAVTMFANMRSAILQTLGAVNYINTSDNNILKAGMALLDVPQYLKDFRTIWFSDYLKDRRSGLMNDVAEAELAQTMNDPRNISVADKFKAANYWILKNGYGPTRVADSFAIAFGGAGFYRNRINTYIKEGMSQDEAKETTMRDFYQVSEVSQQSADVSKISMNQASTKGRLLLSFLNTPFQYSRLIKRSVIDLAKGRGSAANNVAKIVYYGAIQNIFFNFMQNALFSMIWDDDEEQVEGKFDAAKFRTINGAMDTLLRGAGLTGVIMSTAKNVIVKWYERHGDPKAYGDLLLELANVSPSIGIKTRALVKSYKAIEYNMDEIEYKGFSIDNNYAIEALTSLTSALTNVPVDRLVTKINNLQNALDSDLETWQRIWSFLGYSEYNLGINRDKNIELNSRAELKIPELSQNDLKTQDLK